MKLLRTHTYPTRKHGENFTTDRKVETEGGDGLALRMVVRILGDG
jgi:hypothetical protein